MNLSLIFAGTIAVLIATGLVVQVVDLTTRTNVQTSFSEFEAAVKAFVHDDCASIPATFDQDDLIGSGYLTASFDDFGLTWAGEPRDYAQIFVTISGDDGAPKTWLREFGNGIGNPDSSISYYVAVGSATNFHPGFRTFLAYHEVDQTCTM